MDCEVQMLPENTHKSCAIFNAFKTRRLKTFFYHPEAGSDRDDRGNLLLPHITI